MNPNHWDGVIDEIAEAIASSELGAPGAINQLTPERRAALVDMYRPAAIASWKVVAGRIHRFVAIESARSVG